MTETKHLRSRTLGEVEYLFQQGRISEAQFEGYCHAWRTSVTGRFSTLCQAYARHDSINADALPHALELGCCSAVSVSA